MLPSAVQDLGQRFGQWVSSLDHNDDSLLWTLLKFEDQLRSPITIGELHDHAQRMRNGMVPWIRIGQVKELDALLNDSTWRDRSRSVAEFAKGYFGSRGFDNRKAAIPSRWLEDTSA